ncbi:hypothetical protein SPRG_00785 [Saprolegnia parasitica CBS 223.65]|uniref:Uncharacterized protein n=1 Tax=Saprolegnia parasitica (strain CBS 223.65) TaxID=695850 RepID=A0A067CW71_SAPPC|nr:hypothetical protein SPRG_00785 [Saprolegnia parasitica CBS 223.65]KDO34723.1 hypothetical protein SPRG_00785 [Saprolegnia parasitica CBS 223.65]|eukprot:XP_012194392.1 hypothetical protein SPRG_00785 [Saprolegnia parasitica CBS 223.65]
MSSPTGVTLAFLLQFIDDFGGRAAFRGLTTEDVCYLYVLPTTEATNASYLDLYTQTHPDSAGLMTAPANWYLGHTWQSQFLDVVDSITSFVYTVGDVRTTSVWFCLFANNQHEMQSFSFVQYMTRFRSILDATRQLLLVLPDLANPILLRRSWCLFEIFIAHCTGSAIEIASMATADLTFGTDPTALLPCLHAVCTEESEASTEQDEALILQIIDAQLGCDAMDQLVLRILTTWFANLAHTKFAPMQRPATQGMSPPCISSLAN